MLGSGWEHERGASGSRWAAGARCFTLERNAGELAAKWLPIVARIADFIRR